MGRKFHAIEPGSQSRNYIVCNMAAQSAGNAWDAAHTNFDHGTTANGRLWAREMLINFAKKGDAIEKAGELITARQALKVGFKLGNVALQLFCGGGMEWHGFYGNEEDRFWWRCQSK